MDKEYECNFADVTDDELEKYIGWAQSEGVVDGYDDVTFGVDDALTREQAATILFRLSDVVSDDLKPQLSLPSVLTASTKLLK